MGSFECNIIDIQYDHNYGAKITIITVVFPCAQGRGVPVGVIEIELIYIDLMLDMN